MSESYIQNLFAERIGGKGYGKGTEIYKFEKIKRAKRAALSANPGAELIDMGVGEPDEMAFPLSVEALAAEIANMPPAIAATMKVMSVGMDVQPRSGPSMMA